MHPTLTRWLCSLPTELGDEPHLLLLIEKLLPRQRPVKHHLVGASGSDGTGSPCVLDEQGEIRFERQGSAPPDTGCRLTSDPDPSVSSVICHLSSVIGRRLHLILDVLGAVSPLLLESVRSSVTVLCVRWDRPP